MDNNYITDHVDAKVKSIKNKSNIYDVGTVVKINNFIVEISGLDNVMFYERVNISNKAFGYVNSIKEDVVVVALLKIFAPITVGDKASSSNVLYTGAYSDSSMGRVIDLFGEDKLTGKSFEDVRDIPIERVTIPIMDRTTVNRPLLTGISGIDLMYPIGKGQRQLILGDKRTGKTQIGLDTIVNQKGKNVLCFYVAIGKTKKEVKSIYYELVKRGAIDYTTIITAFNDELPPVISLIPYFALSVAEDYMMAGRDVLVIIDDLKRHAEAYREISLLSGKTPGRDAYPADIFYTHSRLLEKGCQHKNGGSITILPIVETKGGDITDYISTNIISITDGQIVLSAKSFQKGEKPAIDYGLSVSRLGGQVQEASIKKVGNDVRRKLLSYLETRSVYELVNMDEMSQELKNKFMEGKIILSSLNQYKFSPRTPEEMLEMFSDFADNPDAVTTSSSSAPQPVQPVETVETTPASAPSEPVAAVEPVNDVSPVDLAAVAPVDTVSEVSPVDLAAVAPVDTVSEVSPVDLAAVAPVDTVSEVSPVDLATVAPVDTVSDVTPVDLAAVAPVEPVEDTPMFDVTTVEPVVEAPTVDVATIEPVVEAPVVVADTPVVEAPVVDAATVEPVVVAETPVVETPVVDVATVEPVVEAPVVVAETPVVEAPVMETTPSVDDATLSIPTDDMAMFQVTNDGDAAVVEAPVMVAEEPQIVSEEPQMVTTEPQMVVEEPQMVVEEPQMIASEAAAPTQVVEVPEAQMVPVNDENGYEAVSNVAAPAVPEAGYVAANGGNVELL